MRRTGRYRISNLGFASTYCCRRGVEPQDLGFYARKAEVGFRES